MEVFIVNPKSGNGYSKYVSQEILNLKPDAKVVYSSSYEDAKSMSSYYKLMADNIYAVGGDGTVNSVLNGIINGKALMGIIPSGSGNDFYHTIDNYNQKYLRSDIGKVNNHYFINEVSFGIDAETCYNTLLMKKLNIPTELIYKFSMYYTFLFYRMKKIKTDLTDDEFHKMMMLTICNGRYYGGGFKIGPNALLNDGLFDVYFMDMKKGAMPSVMPKIKVGEHEDLEHVQKFQTDHIEITSKKPIICNFDGEIIKDNHFNVDMCSEKVTIYNNKELVKRLIK